MSSPRFVLRTANPSYNSSVQPESGRNWKLYLEALHDLKYRLALDIGYSVCLGLLIAPLPFWAWFPAFILGFKLSPFVDRMVGRRVLGDWLDIRS